MKRIYIIIAGLLGLLLLSQAGVAANPNLIANNSVEQINAKNTAPAQWQTDRWGSNKATFSYPTNGQDGKRSVKVEMTNFKSGDAKWYFSPVAVKPNTEYNFSEYYKSNIKTHLVAMSLDAKGNPTYFDVDVNVPASGSNWKQYNTTVKTLASTKTLTILHLIKGNGWLQTDNFTLSQKDDVTPTGTVTPTSTITPTPTSTVTPTITPTPTVTPTPTTPPTTWANPVLNPSVENATSGQPTNWSPSSWGTNSPKYEYVSDGHNSAHSVKLTMQSYTDGDAKWMPDPVKLPAGDYRFTGWYKTNTIPHVVVDYVKPDGSEDFFGMPDPEPVGDSATVWQKYSDTFSVPAGTEKVSVFMFLDGTGWVQADDFSIEPYSYVGFNRPLVSLVFDDGFEENVTNALPVLNQYGFKTTQCFATQYVEGDATQIANVQKFANTGHEICSHSVTHPWFTKLTPAQMDYELVHSQDFLRSITGQAITSFASPYGDYNAQVNTEIRKYYADHRTTDEGYNSKDNLNPYRLRVQNMTPQTTLVQYQSWVNKAKADNTWLILIYHKIDNKDLDAFDTKKAQFDKQMAWLASSGVTVRTLHDALAEVNSQ